MKWIGQQIYDQIVRFRNQVYFEADTVTFTSSNTDDPAVIIENTTVDNQAARLQFKKHRGVDAVDGDNIGEIEFWGYDDGTPSTQMYAKMYAEVHDATSGEESGFFAISVANHDGGNNAGLKLTGGSVDGEVDVEIGRGTASVTDIQGTLSMGGTAAMTNAGLLSVANQSGITGLGTISSGTWQGTAIASAYLDSDTAHLSGTQTFTGDKSFSGATTFTSASSGRPSVEIKNTGNNTNGGSFSFTLDKGAAGADNDIPGTIGWIGDNDAQQQYRFAEIYGTVADATDGQEAGAMYLKVAAYDGVLETGLKLDGDTDADGEVDVTIGAGAASVATIAGTLTMGSTAAMTNAGLLSVANQSNITGVGTISSGEWRGTTVASAYLDADTAHLSGVQTFSGAKTFSAATTTFTSATADSPTIKLLNTTDDDQASQLIFEKLRDDDGVANGQNLGEIWFRGQDASQNTEDYAYIVGEIDVATHGQESGILKLGVANHDGGNGTGIILTGGSENNEIDVTVGYGTSSVTTISGDLTITGDQLTFDSSKGRRACFELTGYSVADGSNYFYSSIMSGNKAPFLHDINIGSDGLTADNPAAFLRANGTVMPYAGTLKIWKGWGASNGSPTVDIGIFKYTPTADDATNDSLVLVKNTQFTGAGNDNLKTFSETSFSVTVAAGDILITAIKGSVNAKTAYFVSTVEIEWS